MTHDAGHQVHLRIRRSARIIHYTLNLQCFTSRHAFFASVTFNRALQALNSDLGLSYNLNTTPIRNLWGSNSLFHYVNHYQIKRNIHSEKKSQKSQIWSWRCLFKKRVCSESKQITEFIESSSASEPVCCCILKLWGSSGAVYKAFKEADQSRRSESKSRLDKIGGKVGKVLHVSTKAEVSK